jgi:hypothetical protein
MLVDPVIARLTAHFWRVSDYALEKRTDPDKAGRARAQAAFQAKRGVKLASNNDEDCIRAIPNPATTS